MQQAIDNYTTNVSLGMMRQDRAIYDSRQNGVKNGNNRQYFEDNFVPSKSNKSINNNTMSRETSRDYYLTTNRKGFGLSADNYTTSMNRDEAVKRGGAGPPNSRARPRNNGS